MQSLLDNGIAGKIVNTWIKGLIIKEKYALELVAMCRLEDFNINLQWMVNGHIANKHLPYLTLMDLLITILKYYDNKNQVLPKKALVEYIPRQDIKLTSSLALRDLKIVGSWDNWAGQIPMELAYNNLKGCE